MLAGDPTTKQRLTELRDELADALLKYPNRWEHITEDEVRVRAHERWDRMAVLREGTRSFGSAPSGILSKALQTIPDD